MASHCYPHLQVSAARPQTFAPMSRAMQHSIQGMPTKEALSLPAPDTASSRQDQGVVHTHQLPTTPPPAPVPAPEPAAPAPASAQPTHQRGMSVASVYDLNELDDDWVELLEDVDKVLTAHTCHKHARMATCCKGVCACGDRGGGNRVLAVYTAHVRLCAQMYTHTHTHTHTGTQMLAEKGLPKMAPNERPVAVKKLVQSEWTCSSNCSWKGLYPAHM